MPLRSYLLTALALSAAISCVSLVSEDESSSPFSCAADRNPRLSSSVLSFLQSISERDLLELAELCSVPQPSHQQGGQRGQVLESFHCIADSSIPLLEEALLELGFDGEDDEGIDKENPRHDRLRAWRQRALRGEGGGGEQGGEEEREAKFAVDQGGGSPEFELPPECFDPVYFSLFLPTSALRVVRY
eukprot:2861324-Rhodomonas_salina.1